MHGTPSQYSQPMAASSPIPNGTLLNVAGSTKTPLGSIPIVVIVLTGLYLVWTFVHQHERINEELEPKNIAANLHNLALIGLSAVVALLFLKLLTAKLAMLTKWEWMNAIAITVGAA